MEKILLLVAVLVGVMAQLYFTAIKTERLEARVAQLEQSPTHAAPLPVTAPVVDSNARISRLESRVANVESAFAKALVRQRLDGNLKHIRDVPY